MKSVVIAYEDAYHEHLHRLIKALRRDAELAGMILEARTALGTGGFVNEVPRLLRAPLKQTKLPPDRVVCVADADRPQNLVPNAAAAPKGNDRQASDGWVCALEESWHGHLVRQTHLPDDSATRLRVICLRWSKETVLTSSPAALLDHASRLGRRAQVESILRDCIPCPTALADEDFVLRYSSPGRCLDEVFQAIEDRRYKKGRDDEDILRDWICPNPDRRAEVLRRCPDLRRLLRALDSEDVSPPSDLPEIPNPDTGAH